MHDSNWIKKGTTAFPRPYGRESTVYRASNVFFAMYDPKIAVKHYGYHEGEIGHLTDFLCSNFGFDAELMENTMVDFDPKDRKKRDIKITVSSWRKKDNYTGVLR